ncbi:MAG: amino acid racemase [Patescibacteria group bacterium]|nr:amino acid racemase [Patescibacteria group bacterium]
MSNYKLGIIGGMGPEATADFFTRIVEKTDTSSDQEHLDLVILNHSSISDRTTAIESKEYEPFISQIKKDLEILEKIGVEIVAIPCNTAHFFYHEIQSQTKIRIINMIEESLKYATQNYTEIKKIGIMATDGTINSKIYENECKKYNIETITPSEKNQEVLMDIIYNGIKKEGKGDIKDFMKVADELKEKGCNIIIIGCTELSYFKKNCNLPEYFVDAMDTLVIKSIELSGKKIKKD